MRDIMEVDQPVLIPGGVLSGTVAHQGVDISHIMQCEEPDNQVNQLANSYNHLALRDCAKQYDAIILHSDDDDDEVFANVLKERLKNIPLKTGDQPQVALFSEVYPGITDVFERLDTVLHQTTLVMAVMTKALVNEDPDNRQKVYGAFSKFLKDHNNTDRFIPVYNENPRQANWIPALIRPNRGLDYNNYERDLRVIKKTFEFHLSKRKKREQKLREEALASVTPRDC